MNYKLLIVLPLLFGCNATPPDVQRNKQAIASGGEEVGHLPDGRVIRRFWIDNGTTGMGENRPIHWVYYVEGKTLTVNHEERHGKTTKSHVEVFIDGELYVPKPQVEAE